MSDTHPFDDSLDFDAEIKVEAKPRPAFKTGKDYEPTINRLVVETCKHCGGTGFWRGRRDYPCFKCKGQGKKAYKTSTEQRARQREHYAENKTAARQEYAEQYKAEVAWVREQTRRQEDRMGRPPFKHWDFPGKMSDALLQYGSWTDGQLEAIRKCMARDAERKATYAAENAAPRKTCDPSKLTSAFARARAAAAEAGEGIKYLALTIGGFRFTPDKTNTTDVWVKADGQWLGKTEGGQFKKFRACTPEQEGEIIAICDDPSAAAEAHGLRTGTCSCCGRELTNEESRRLGIGPICRAKWGL